MALVGAALVMFPGADFATTLAAFAGIWFVALAVYRWAGDTTAVGRYWLLLVATALAVGIVVNVYTVTTLHGADTSHPTFSNYDMSRYYYGAARLYDPAEGYWEGRNNAGFSWLICQLWRLTGWTVVSPLMANMLITLLTIVMTGVLTKRLLSGATGCPQSVLMTAGMIGAGMVTYFTFSGTLMMKEPLTAFCLAASALSIVELRRGHLVWIYGLLFVAAAAVVGFIRYYWVVIPLAGLLLTLSRNPMSAVRVVILIAIVAVIYICGERFVLDGATMPPPADMTSHLEYSFLQPAQGREGYYAFLERIQYFDLPWWERLMWLPVTAAVQFLIPLPWNFAAEAAASPTLMIVKFGFPWYAVGGMLIYYFGWCVRRSPRELLGITLWAAMFWLGFAWMGGGTVSRYAFNLLPLLVPAAVYALAVGWGRKSLRIWTLAYWCLLGAALVAAFMMQKGGGAV